MMPLLSLVMTFPALLTCLTDHLSVITSVTWPCWLASGTPLAFLAMAPIGAVTDTGAGTVSGSIKVGEDTVEFKYAYALLRDNAEGIFDGERELRIALTEEEIDPAWLIGAMSVAIIRLGHDGAVRGAYLTFDPDNQTQLSLTPLIKPDNPDMSLGTISLSNTEGLWEKFNLADDRVTGKQYREYKSMTSFGDAPYGFTFEFSAPVAKEPAVTETLEGEAALDSPQASAFRTSLEAIKAGDYDAYVKVLTKRAIEDREQHFAESGMTREEFLEMLSEGIDEQIAMAGAIARIIVRGDRATMIISHDEFGQMFVTCLREDGAWKID